MFGKNLLYMRSLNLWITLINLATMPKKHKSSKFQQLENFSVKNLKSAQIHFVPLVHTKLKMIGNSNYFGS